MSQDSQCHGWDRHVRSITRQYYRLSWRDPSACTDAVLHLVHCLRCSRYTSRAQIISWIFSPSFYFIIVSPLRFLGLFLPLSFLPTLVKKAYVITMLSVYRPYQLQNGWTKLYATRYVYHGTWAHLNGVLHKSLPSVCVCVCIPPIVARQRLVETLPRQQIYTRIAELLNAFVCVSYRC
jgi:hypothetical protein